MRDGSERKGSIFITVMKELGNVIIISISSFKIYEDMNKFSLQRMSNKGKSFSPTGRVFPCNGFSGLGKEVFWGQWRHWMQAAQNCTPASCSAAAVPWHPRCSLSQEQRAGLVGDFICPQLYLVVQCQCGGDSRTQLRSSMWSAAQLAFGGAPLVYLGGSFGTVYCFSAVRWKNALGTGSNSIHLLLQEQGT